MSPDGLHYTFSLRQGLKFHDGTPVTAEDAVTSLRRWGQKDALGKQLMRATAQLAAEQFIPVLAMREGALRVLGIPQADGYIAYLTLLNERDGGINGVPLVWEDCDTVFDVSAVLRHSV